ncbi:hypothetical protein TL16_g06414 [Triparma laevis f. inornata]|uniref:Uncharacterized protein n=2 Tax=Triparma laevis TaxID=1534972 RepID=A0A9W6ZRS0_9STRA|nr:hypothetical protein TrLO_g1561 [Triparma laevis f. longispina]GMH74261.1 hypothetical protein TL16_g06414 [Triparma laevis f. inornata]
MRQRWAAGAGMWATANAKKGVNTEALGKLMEGGGGGPIGLERLNIGINFAQNFGLVVTLKFLPDDFKKWFEWFGVLGFDFKVFGGMGEEVSIALGLLVPARLIYEFDARLYRERKNFRFYYMFNDGEGTCPPLLYLYAVASFLFTAVALACVCGGWIDNDLANAFILVLSGLRFVSFLRHLCLRREYTVADSANEDFVKKRQENEMFFFLFFYTVAYLSGVSACTKLIIAETITKKAFGRFSIPFYVLVPLWRLRGGAASATTAVKKATEGQSYKDSLGVFRK